MLSKKATQTIIWITIFGIAMAYLESAVVVYMRALYYPDGFSFPLQPIDFNLVTTEIFRELATLVMLIGAGIMAGRKPLEKFAYFIYTFAIWDIFYYVFLKLLLDWPDSLLTWDILFLIPTTWVGPVIGPIINSITMIVLARFIIFFTDKNGYAKMRKLEWALLITGSVITIISYTEEYVRFMMQKFSFGDVFDFSKADKLMEYALNYVPEQFSWWIFIVGEAFFFVAIYLFWKRNRTRFNFKKNNTNED